MLTYRLLLDIMANIMKNITKTEITIIRSIKASIVKMEESLNEYMDMDISDANVRRDIRNITNNIAELETSLYNALKVVA